MLFAETNPDDSNGLLLMGISVLASVIVALAGIIWRTAVWTRDNVVTPTVKSHLELIDALKTEMPAQTTALKQIAGTQGEHMNEVKAQGVKLDKLHNAAEANGIQLKEIAKATDASSSKLEEIAKSNSGTFEFLKHHDEKATEIMKKLNAEPA